MFFLKLIHSFIAVPISYSPLSPFLVGFKGPFYSIFIPLPSFETSYPYIGMSRPIALPI
jgi:hypothetical protein